MAIEHDAIADAELHEPKGVAGASANRVYVSNGAGSGAWTAYDLNPHVQVYMSGNTTNTTIATAATPVIVAGTFVQNIASGFSSDSTGRVTYTNADTKVFRASVDAAVEIVATGADDVKISLAKNGTVISTSKVTANVALNAETVMSLNWLVSLATNDYLEVFIENADTTENILVRDIQFSVQ